MGNSSLYKNKKQRERDSGEIFGSLLMHVHRYYGLTNKSDTFKSLI